MAKQFYTDLLQSIRKFRQDHPLIFLSASIGLMLFIYYLIVLLPLNHFLEQRQQTLKQEFADFKWMARASQEISRLKKLTSSDKQKTIDTPFAYINQQVNNQTWSAMVTDVRQLDQNQVQISFKEMPYTLLMAWLQTTYQESGIFVAEATMERVNPGIVDAMFVLRAHKADENGKTS